MQAILVARYTRLIHKLFPSLYKKMTTREVLRRNAKEIAYWEAKGFRL